MIGRKALDQNPLDEKVLDEKWAHGCVFATNFCPPFQHLLSERRQSLGQKMLERWAKISCENATVGKNGMEYRRYTPACWPFGVLGRSSPIFYACTGPIQFVHFKGKYRTIFQIVWS